MIYMKEVRCQDDTQLRKRGNFLAESPGEDDLEGEPTSKLGPQKLGCRILRKDPHGHGRLSHVPVASME